MPKLRLIAGPNGSGKTTLTTQLREQYAVRLGQYLNPDDIAKHIDLSELLTTFSGLAVKEVSTVNIEHAAKIAQRVSLGLREDWIRDQLSFSYESVMSHHSHLDFFNRAKAEGFKAYLYYVCTSDPEINIARVEQRVELGGHSVPTEKILQRYHRSLELLPDMAKTSRRSYFFDNSTRQLTFIAEVTPDGYLDIVEKNFDRAQPLWFANSVIKNWPREKIRLSRV
ncbi:zeta toxin family protein [Rheinheimera aquimaris]|uniref:zeta toxin family protein n=1 Tax=Rheinheimera aquimaris TaxID=412437 RepID=UPI003A9863B9